jgi:hypothetical protein
VTPTPIERAALAFVRAHKHLEVMAGSMYGLGWTECVCGTCAAVRAQQDRVISLHERLERVIAASGLADWSAADDAREGAC